MKTRIVLHSFEELSFPMVLTQTTSANPAMTSGPNTTPTPPGLERKRRPPATPTIQLWLTATAAAQPIKESPLNEF